MNSKLNTVRISHWVRLLFLSTVVGTLCVPPLWSTLAQQPEMKSVYQIVKSGNGQILGVTYNGGMPRSAIDLFDSATGQLLRTVDISPSLPNTIALSPRGDRIAHAGPDGDLGIFDIGTGIDTSITTGSPDTIQEVEWNPVSDQVAYAVGSAVIILDTLSGKSVQIVMTGGPLVGEIAWSPNGRYLTTSHYAENPLDSESPFRAIKIWDMSSSENPLTVPMTTLKNRGGGRVSWSPEGRRLAFLESYHLSIFDTVTYEITVDISLDEEFLHNLTWNNVGSLLATGGYHLRIWDTTTWKVSRTITLAEPISSLQWSLEGEHIFNDGGQDGLYRDDLPVSQIPVTPTGAPDN